MKTISDRSIKRPPAEPQQHLSALWSQFISEFPSEDLCLKEIVNRLLSAGAVVCGSCRIQNVKMITSRTALCLECGDIFSATAKTFFAHMRRYQAWLAAIWLMERGVIISGNAFHKLLNIAQSSAREILHKLMAVLTEKMNSNQLVAPSAVFMPLFCKRSCETVAREHPRSEETALACPTESASPAKSASPTESESTAESASPTEPVATEPVQAGQADNKILLSTKVPDACGMSETIELAARGEQECDSMLSSEEATVLRLLTRVPKNVSALCLVTGTPDREMRATLTSLELSGHCRRLEGNNYVLARFERADVEPGRSKKPLQALTVSVGPTVSVVVAAVIDYIRSVFHGISRKYLQFYLGAHWCFVDRERWGEGALFQACIARGPLTYREVYNTVTERLVRFASIRSADPDAPGNSAAA